MRDAEAERLLADALDARRERPVAAQRIRVPHGLELYGAVLHLGGCLDDLLRAAEHVVVGLGRLAAHLELEIRRLADDVAARARVERADVQLRRRVAVAGDGVQVQNGGRRGEQCVAALLRGDARVGGAAVERHVQLGGGKTACSVMNCKQL